MDPAAAAGVSRIRPSNPAVRDAAGHLPPRRRFRTCALPRDAYRGSGAKQQVTLVAPSLELIAVRNGEALGPAGFDTLAAYFTGLMKAAVSIIS